MPDELTRGYSQAIFEKAVERWRRPLMALQDALGKSEQAADLDSPSVPLEKKKDVFHGLLPPDTDNEVRNFAYLLASKNQVHLLPDILSEFERLLARTPAAQVARVTSAVELSPDERRQLEEKVRSIYGKDLEFDYRVDKSILGGLIVRIGDRVIDGSVASKLAAMKQKLETAG